MSEFNFMLDSNICIYLLNGASEELIRRVAGQDEGSLCCSAISLAEIAVGFGEKASQAPELRDFLDVIPAVPFDEAAGRTYGGLPFRRAKFDRLIAAHALSLAVTLITNNEADFADMPSLKVENWTLPQ